MTQETDHGLALLDFCLAEDAPKKNAEAKAAYEAWVAADRAWMEELTKAFGADACNRRYDFDQSEHPPECKFACLKWQAAGARARTLLGWNRPAETEPTGEKV